MRRSIIFTLLAQSVNWVNQDKSRVAFIFIIIIFFGIHLGLFIFSSYYYLILLKARSGGRRNHVSPHQLHHLGLIGQPPRLNVGISLLTCRKCYNHMKHYVEHVILKMFKVCHIIHKSCTTSLMMNNKYAKHLVQLVVKVKHQYMSITINQCFKTRLGRVSSTSLTGTWGLSQVGSYYKGVFVIFQTYKD